MKTIHTKLHLQQHRHTGKVLHHHQTSFRGLLIVFVVAGASMTGLNMLSRATANSFAVGGTVLAPVPENAAVITAPLAGAVVRSASTMISGSCPFVSPQVVVSIVADGNNVGSGTCDNEDRFAVRVGLPAGVHSIVARTSTITGQQGPDSTPIAITYTQVSTAPEITYSGTVSYIGASTDITQDIHIAGGTAPYLVSTSWGDGYTETVDTGAGLLSLTHSYKSVQPYTFAVAIVDSTGAKAMRQFAVAAYATALPSSTNTASSSTLPLTTPTIAGMYGLFVTTIAVSGIVWIEGRKIRKEHAFAH